MVNQITKPTSEDQSNKTSPSLDFRSADIAEVIRHLKSDARSGLTEDVALVRLTQIGRNEVKGRQSSSVFDLFIRQVQSSVVVLLLVASAISFITQEVLQAVAILLAVVINAFVGLATEWKAQISLAALSDMSGPTARVVRTGRHHQISACELVPGDIVILEAGSRVPADMRLIEAHALSIDESIMTGESMPVSKSAKPVDGEEPDITLAFHGTHVLAGRGRAVVTNTGKDSSLGKLQTALFEEERTATPLEVRLDELGRQLSILTVLVCVLVAGVGLIYRHDVWSMLEAGIALAVAAIPEGLPVVATLALAIGTQRMVKEGVLIRQLSAVETLGCTTVICSDKTGTLTENKLLVTDICVDGRQLKVSGFGYAPAGNITERGRIITRDSVLALLMKATALCNDAKLIHNDEDGTWRVAGDPTEGALLAAAGKLGLDLKSLRDTNPRISELPFDLVRKKMATVHNTGEPLKIAYTKGSPEVIVKDSKHLQTSDGPILFTDAMKSEYLRVNQSYAERGLRVLGVAMKQVDSESNINEEIDYDLTFLGLVAMKDLPRRGVDQAIQKCKEAGIHVMMLTGDQPKTAKSIASDLSILSEQTDQGTIEGKQIAELEESEVAERLGKVTVVARVTPDLKLAIVKALQSKGEIVAMTGDGVNDAPSLQQANIGIAMGRAGTDLAKEVSNMVITDDNFTTIVIAIEQGRIIYDNIRRSICYLLTATVASVVTIATAMIFMGTLALNPLQLLWLNLIMHVFPGLGIVLQGAAPGMMQRPPRDPSEKLLGGFECRQILIRAILVTAAVIGTIVWCNRCGISDDTTMTIAFATISLGLLFQAWNWLSVSGPDDQSRQSAPINSFMYLMMAISYALVAIAIYVPGLATVLGTVPLSMPDIGIAIMASTVSLLVTNLCGWLSTKGKKTSLL